VRTERAGWWELHGGSTAIKAGVILRKSYGNGFESWPAAGRVTAIVD